MRMLMSVVMVSLLGACAAPAPMPPPPPPPPPPGDGHEPAGQEVMVGLPETTTLWPPPVDSVFEAAVVCASTIVMKAASVVPTICAATAGAIVGTTTSRSL